MHSMCLMRSYTFCHFMQAWIQQGAENISQRGLVHADSIVMHSFCYRHMPHHPKGALFGWDMTSAQAMGGKPRSLCLFPILQWCVHVKWHHISLHVAIWIVNGDHEGHILTLTPCMSHRTPGFLRSRFIFPPLSHAILVRTYIASFSCSLLTGVESGIALCCSSPSNSRLNDVCFLKYPSSHCCCTELSFICGLLTWASFAIVLWLLSWVTEVPILRIASDILRSQSA